MRSSVPISSTPTVLIMTDELRPTRPTTLLLQKNHPHSYNYWTLQDRLRLQNEKLLKRQQSSCRITIYSLWLFAFSTVTSIVIYRFTDECLETQNGKLLVVKCLRYWLLLVTIGISSLACCGVIFGSCKYVQSRCQSLQYKDEYQLHSQNNSLLPMTTISRSSHYSASFADDSPLASCRRYLKPNDRYSNTTEISSSLTNASLQRNILLCNDEKLSTISDANIISKSSNIINNKNMFLLLPRSTALSLQSNSSPTEITSNSNHTMTSNDKSQSTSINEHTRYNSLPVPHMTYLSGVDIWERQQQEQSLSSFY